MSSFLTAHQHIEGHFSAIANCNLELVGYADANWASDHGDRNSTSSKKLYKLGKSIILWSSKKQLSVALSYT